MNERWKGDEYLCVSVDFLVSRVGQGELSQIRVRFRMLVFLSFIVTCVFFYQVFFFFTGLFICCQIKIRRGERCFLVLLDRYLYFFFYLILEFFWCLQLIIFIGRIWKFIFYVFEDKYFLKRFIDKDMYYELDILVIRGLFLN